MTARPDVAVRQIEEINNEKTPGGAVMLRFRNKAEQTAWSIAEALAEKGFSTMRQAEAAAETFRKGQELTRQRFEQKGLSEADADIRWSGTSQAKKALADNSYFMAQSTMYHGAAAAQYARALYLAQHEE